MDNPPTLDSDCEKTNYGPQVYVFDHYFLRHDFPVVNANFNPVSHEILLERHEQLLIPAEEKKKLTVFGTNIRSFLQRMVDDEPQLFKGFNEFGAAAKNVLINVKPLIVDFVVYVKYAPDVILTEQVISRLLAIGNMYGDLYSIEKSNFEEGTFLFYSKMNPDMRAKIHTGVYEMTLKGLGGRVNSKPSKKTLAKRNQAVKHVAWIQQNCNNDTLLLVRLFKDMRLRFEGFKHLNPWMIEVLLHYCAMVPNCLTPVVHIQDAFLRAFQLLSAGILLPDSKSITDPLDMRETSIQAHIPMQQLDRICCTAQTLLRVMNYSNGIRVILGLDPDTNNIEQNTTIWDGVYVTPSVAVCNDDYNESNQ